MFGKTPDPDFAEVTLLEQYQAQIGSALTPAFAADSSPELAAEAINVCATFIATGIVTDVDRMGRILKLLVSALQNFSSRCGSSLVVKVANDNRRNGNRFHWRSQRTELQLASHGQNGSLLSLG
jgi:hypothetical protein